MSQSSAVALPAIKGSPERWMHPVARTVYRLSKRVWGEDGAIPIVGRSQALQEVLEKVVKAAPFSEPVLILGESGTGKELLAKALYLLSPRRGKPFITVNCPQHQEGNLTVSELFGHKKGSFTGAVADRAGAFALAENGVIFLDEVADLHSSAQVMLLRVLATGDYQALGDSRTRKSNARVLAATNRSLNALGLGDGFRKDLYFRLRYFRIQVPPLRERGEDWRELIEFILFCLARRYGVAKTMAPESWERLARHSWPGNVRELASVTTMGYAMAEGSLIFPCHFMELLGEEEFAGRRREDEVLRELFARKNFWRLVHDSFLERDLNRGQVQYIIRTGLAKVGGSYRRLITAFGLPPSDYQRFMDFLRHHRLKPS